MTNVKKSNQSNEALPPALQSAMSAAEATLEKHEKLSAVLAETGRAIPQALAEERRLRSELGAVEVAGGAADGLGRKLQDAAAAREAAARRRASASQALLELGGDELRRVRADLDRARAEYAAAVAADFSRRWDAACRALVMLSAESAALSRTLGRVIETPSPYMVAESVTGGRPTTRLAVPGEAVPSLPPGLAALAGTIDRLDAAATLGAGLRQSREIDQRHQALARLQGTPGTMAGVFRASRSFSHLGVDYPQGTLMDSSLLTSGELHRFWKAKHLELVDAEPGRAAA